MQSKEHGLTGSGQDGCFGKWLEAARLRTLPLSTSGVILGGGLAACAGHFNWLIFILSMLVAVSLQILSNFANDYGDAVKGSDGPGRVGPRRAVASGAISPAGMYRGIMVMICVCALDTLLLLWASFGASWQRWVIFLILAAASVAAAIFYTMGRHPYGYMCLGDVFVFVFFGPVAVAGAFFLYGPPFTALPLLPACATGLFATAVLNINNIRDMDNDRANGKNTLALRLGGHWARIYHLFLIGGGLLCWLVWLPLYGCYAGLPLLLAAIPLVLSTWRVWSSHSPDVLDAQLRMTSISAGLFNLVMALALPPVFA